MATTTTSAALKHWKRIIKRWPVDKVRPENVSFQTVMQRRLDRVHNPSAVPQDKKAKGNATLVSAPPLVWNEQKELQQTDALYSLLEDKYASHFPMPAKLRHPASNPEHYDNLIQEIEEAPNRSWFSNFVNRIKGGLRFK